MNCCKEPKILTGILYEMDPNLYYEDSEGNFYENDEGEILNKDIPTQLEFWRGTYCCNSNSFSESKKGEHLLIYYDDFYKKHEKDFQPDYWHADPGFVHYMSARHIVQYLQENPKLMEKYGMQFVGRWLHQMDPNKGDDMLDLKRDALIYKANKNLPDYL